MSDSPTSKLPPRNIYSPVVVRDNNANEEISAFFSTGRVRTSSSPRHVRHRRRSSSSPSLCVRRERVVWTYSYERQRFLNACHVPELTGEEERRGGERGKSAFSIRANRNGGRDGEKKRARMRNGGRCERRVVCVANCITAVGV